MARRKHAKGSPASDDLYDLQSLPLQAILLADSFAQKFRPITLERPKVLLPLAGVPMIEYTLAWLESIDVREVFVFCCAHAQQVKDHLKCSQERSPDFSISVLESQDAISVGDALRFIYNLRVINGDFLLVSGDTICNMSLTQVLQEHKDRRKRDARAVMTMVIKRSKPSLLTHQTRLGNDEIFMAIDPATKELLYYEDKADSSEQLIPLDKDLFTDIQSAHLHNDMEDCYIDICSPEVLSLFTDNFDYQHLRRHFVKGLLVDDIMGYRIFTHEIDSSYAARVDNFRSYDTISKDIIQRWTFPLVPDIPFSPNFSPLKRDRQEIYKAPDVSQSSSAQITAFSIVGCGTTIGGHCVISESVIGRGCNIGDKVSIHGSYIWDNVIIGNDCKISHATVCDGVRLSAGVVLEPGVILSFKVGVGQQFVVRAYSKISLLPQPCKQDSDEEGEYADVSGVVVDSPSINSAFTAVNESIALDLSSAEERGPSEVAILGGGYIWSTCEGGHEEEWRHSIAPISSEKLMELSQRVSTNLDVINLDGDITASGELLPESGCIGVDDGDGDNNIVADFDKEVEATFLRDLTGTNQENVILEINSLRLSFDASHADCAGALFYAVIKSSLTAHYDSNTDLLANTMKVIMKWKGLLKHYLKGEDEEIEVLLRFEDICTEVARELSPFFSRILHHLYEEDIITEDAILSWATEKEGADESDKNFVKQSEQFIRWLKEAEVEDDGEVEDD